MRKIYVDKLSWSLGSSPSRNLVRPRLNEPGSYEPEVRDQRPDVGKDKWSEHLKSLKCNI